MSQQIDWIFIGTKIFDILLQGCLAGLIVLLFTEWFRKRREKRALRQSAILLTTELQSHEHALTALSKCPESAVFVVYDWDKRISDSLWKDVRLSFTSIDNSYFYCLALYYMILPRTTNLLKVSQEYQILPEEENLFDKALVMCRIASLIAQAFAQADRKSRKALLIQAEKVMMQAMASYPDLFADTQTNAMPSQENSSTVP